MNAASSVLALGVLLLTFESGLCTRCYQCVSANSNDCKDTFNKDGQNIAVVDCDGKEVENFYTTSLQYLHIVKPKPGNGHCVKMVLDTKTGDSFIRTCVEGTPDNNNKTCKDLVTSQSTGQTSQTLNNENNFKYCNICTGDNCNGAAGNAASLTLAAGAAALGYFRYY